jgi:hypothetical protein
MAACILFGCSSRRPDEERATSYLTACSTVVASSDTMISNPPIDQSFGKLPILRAGGKDEALVRFDLGSIPRAASISIATLKMSISGSDSTAPVNTHEILAPWSETSTYASFGQGFDPAVIGGFTTTSTNVQKSVDLTALTKSWLAGSHANYGVLFETYSSKKTIFVSREGGTPAQRPQLQVCYTVPDDHCAPNPCQNGGACANTATGFACACAAGYTGPTCDTVVDNCAGQPCLHGAICTNAVGSYACQCAPGYTGANCETVVDNCAPNPCQNGGACTSTSDGHACLCPPGYSGASCETLVDSCASAPCLNGATCRNGVNTYTCTCATGFAGTNCENNIDECATTPCRNGGTCVDGVNSYTCSCAPGWGGTNCDVDLDQCAQHPCLNGGTCSDSFGSYACACAPGYTGANCEIDIDECAPRPCQHGGTCTDGVAAFTCTCASGYTGSSCATPPQFQGMGMTVAAPQGSPVYAGVAAVYDTVYEPSAVQATIDWGDGQITDPAGTQFRSPNQFVVTDARLGTGAAAHYYASVGSYDVISTVSSPTGAVATFHSTVIVTPQLTAFGMTVAGTANASFISAPVAGFVDPIFDDPVLIAASRFAATIDWGDGETGPGYFWGLERFAVPASFQRRVFAQTAHMYRQAGSFPITITVTDKRDGAATVINSTAEIGEQLKAFDVTAAPVQGAVYRGAVAAMYDARGFIDTPASFTGTIDWGDGTTSPAGFTAGATNLDFSVRDGGSHVYATAGKYDVTVSISAIATGATAVAHSIAIVSPQPPPGAIAHGLSFHTLIMENSDLPLATFSDPDTDPTGLLYTAFVDWGDGPGYVGTVIGGQGEFTVWPDPFFTPHRYESLGTFTVTVTIKKFRASTQVGAITTTSTATVDPELLVHVPASFDARVGDPIEMLIASVTNRACRSMPSSGIFWGDGDAGVLFFDRDEDPQPGVTLDGWANPASFLPHVYRSQGTYDVEIRLTDCSKQSTTVHTTANVGPGVAAYGATFHAAAGVAFRGAVASFTSSAWGETSAVYETTIDWGDGAQEMAASDESVSGIHQGFAVWSAGQHAYAHNGSYDVTVTVHNRYSSETVVVHSTAIVD